MSTTKKKPLVEGVDFYYNEQGFFVMTEKFLKERGFCCKNGCKHCPYDFKKDSKQKEN